MLTKAAQWMPGMLLHQTLRLLMGLFMTVTCLALSSGLRVLSDVLLIIPLMAATISGPFIKAGIPSCPRDLELSGKSCLRARTVRPRL